MIPHVTQVRVRWGECDPAGIVYYPTYFVYFDLGSEAYLRESAPDWRERLQHDGLRGFPRIDAHAKYRASARSGDILEVLTSVPEVTRKVVTFTFQIRRPLDDVLLVEGQVKAVVVNAQGRAANIPSWFSDMLVKGPPDRRA